VAFVLLLATANIASLMLARATVRQREMAVRSALGARTPRLARQLLTEAMLLSLAGGGAGVALAYFLIGPSTTLFPPFLAGLGVAPAINANVLLVTLVATVLVGLFTSLAPVAQVARRRGSLGLAATGRQFASRSTRRVRQVFTVAQVALAVMLLSGATVMLRSMDQLARVDTGIDEDRILTMRLSLNLDKYERDEVAPFFESVTERLAAIPGVVSASAATQFPPANGFRAAMVTEEPRQAGAASTTVDVTNATGKHAETLGLRLLSGRHFMAADGAEAPRVVQLNAAASQRFFGDASPLGRRVGLVAGEDTAWHEVVGVVSDARNRGLDAPVMPEVFVPVRQQQVAWNNQLYLLVRASGNPAALMPSVREVLRSIDPTQPVYMVRTMEAAFAESLSIRRAASWLLVSFAVIALVLAAVGLYGILSYLVSARTHEIGVRMALGANERSVVGLVMRETAWLVGIGAAIGLGGVMAVRGMISAIAFEAGAADPVTLAVSLALLMGTALLAGFAPTRRAVRVDPLESLRNQ
jgi:putative ABC transport system permease protein